MFPNRDTIDILKFKLGKIQMKQRRNNNGVKYFLDICQNELEKHPGNTDEWLLIKSILKEKVAIKSLLKLGDFHQEDVVVKIGKYDDLYREYLISQLLFENDIPGFIPYICFFTCPDNIEYYTLKENKKSFCDNIGSNMSAIVMPFFPEKSLGDRIKERTIEFSKVIECIVTVIENLEYAYNKVNFIHRDTHLGNILIEKDVAYLIDYGDSVIVPLEITNKSKKYYDSMHLLDYTKLLNELYDTYAHVENNSKDISNRKQLYDYLIDAQDNKINFNFPEFIENGIKNMQLVDF